MKSVDLIGHTKFLPWGQLDGCSLPLSVKGVACETWSQTSSNTYVTSNILKVIHTRVSFGSATENYSAFLYLAELQ